MKCGEMFGGLGNVTRDFRILIGEYACVDVVQGFPDFRGLFVVCLES